VAAVVSLVVVGGVIVSIFAIFTPLVAQIAQFISSVDFERVFVYIQGPLATINETIRTSFPNFVPANFKIEEAIVSAILDLVNTGSLSSAVTSVTNFLTSLFVAIFSIVFISFFFLESRDMLTDTIVNMSPDRYEDKIRRVSDSISDLLRRYFVGIIIESSGITLINTILLLLVAKFNFQMAIVIAAITGILNVIPYVGPLIGHIIAMLMGALLYTTVGYSSFGIYLLIIFACTMSTQLVDNYFFQPFIYSNSVKAHPLEIFIVILMAAQVGGMLGMLVAVPAYTVLRVCAKEFLGRFKVAKALTQTLDEE
jgi:predicted PurR-regulated permease PerM